MLGRAFTWTCEMYIPANQTVNAVTFFRNGLQCGSIGLVSTTCNMISTDPKYTLGCLSESSYTLTIPAEHMTEYEQGSVWRCKYVGDSRVKSTDVTLKIASKSKDMEPSKHIKTFFLYLYSNILNFFTF